MDPFHQYFTHGTCPTALCQSTVPTYILLLLITLLHQHVGEGGGSGRPTAAGAASATLARDLTN